MNYIAKVYDAKLRHHPAAESDLLLINRFAKNPLSPDNIYIASMHLATNVYDRSFERFPDDYLVQFARTIVGKSLLIGHNHKGPPEGLFFKAEVVSIPHPEIPANLPSAKHPKAVRAWFYIVKTQQNEHLRAQIDGGVYRYVSVGFHYEDLNCDFCGNSLYSADCPHVPGEEYQGRLCTATYTGQAEAVEGSIVYLGCQFGAQLVQREPHRRRTRILALKQAPPDSSDLSGHPKSSPLPEGEEVGPRPSEKDPALHTLLADGHRYRQLLRQEILRLASATESLAEYDFLEKHIHDAPAETLEQIKSHFEARFDAKFPPRPLSSLPLNPNPKDPSYEM